VKYSIIIPTFNRADYLADTLRSLADLRSSEPWEAIVVDNNSTDDTRSVVSNMERSFPARLHYVFEREQGRSAALNSGIRASSGDVILTTDDDIRAERDWLDSAGQAFNRFPCDYVCGKVLPLWGGTKPAWFTDRPSRLWAVLGLWDHGPAALELENHSPPGPNIAFRRQAFDRAGVWSTTIGRKAGTLLGQEVREWRVRATAAGLRGFYTPDMVVRHYIPPERLTKRYFRRWFYWNGISRAILYREFRMDMEAPERTTLDFATVPHIAGIPRYLYRTLLESLSSAMQARIRRDPATAFQHELFLWFFAGMAVQRWRDRRVGQQP
jgi:glycosyltransferase involved in cell wall biosynthesis